VTCRKKEQGFQGENTGWACRDLGNCWNLGIEAASELWQPVERELADRRDTERNFSPPAAIIVQCRSVQQQLRRLDSTLYQLGVWLGMESVSIEQ
jgi:hypothetical protein